MTLAKVLFLGDSPDAREEARHEAFSDTVGFTLDSLLHEVGLLRTACVTAYVCPYRPLGGNLDQWISSKKTCPDTSWIHVGGKWIHPTIQSGIMEIRKLLFDFKPEVIVAMGNLPLWLLTGEWGVKTWRGSMLRSSLAPQAIVIPTYHPSQLHQDFSLKPYIRRDLARVADVLANPGQEDPPKNYILRPTFEQTKSYLQDKLLRAQEGQLFLGGDFETRSGHIACLGLAHAVDSAICIPFMCQERNSGYFYLHEEQEIVLMLKELLTHPNVSAIFQNGSYDAQYFQRWWGFVPNIALDTMVVHHSTFSGMPKALGFLASLHCKHYVYWKEDGKLWEKDMDEDKLWLYCCKDCTYMFEIAINATKLCDSMGLLPVAKKQHDIFWPNLWAMVRGLRVNDTLRAVLSLDLQTAIIKRQEWIEEAVGHELNLASPKQLMDFFYTEMGIRPVISRKTKKPTTDDDALPVIAHREPILKPICDVIAEVRSLSVLNSTFVEAQKDRDGRMRSSFNICGTETYRLSSSKNAFWNGMNLQNVTSGNEESRTEYPYPNLRKMFIPDYGMEFFDMDLDRADLQVVVWEAEDEELKTLLRLGVDLHIVNGLQIFGKSVPPYDELIESHPNYSDHKGRAKKERQFAKNFIHGTNYGGGERTMAITVGISVAESGRYQKRWFQLHPGIKTWHARTLSYLESRRYVENKFGYRRYYFDRTEGLLPEALAWVPQSTVGITINRIWEKVWEADPKIETLIQVHDSLAGQFPIITRDSHIRVLKNTKVVIPYDDPLVIPTGLKTSTKSWGHCS